MKKTTETWDANPKGNEERERVTVHIGDTVIDMMGDEGTFEVEEINDNGWVWGNQMKTPYFDDNGVQTKNFMDNNMSWKL